jgi:hypothetical protein
MKYFEQLKTTELTTDVTEVFLEVFPGLIDFANFAPHR